MGTFGEPEQPENHEKPEQPVTSNEIIPTDANRMKATIYFSLHFNYCRSSNKSIAPNTINYGYT